MTDFDEICEVAPSLRELYERIPEIMSEGPNPWRQWSIIKRRFSGIVGWYGDPQLAGAYDLVYSTMLREAERYWKGWSSRRSAA